MSVQVFKGKYKKGITTMSNSLIANMQKHPEIQNRIIDLYPQFRTTWLFEKLGLFKGGTIQGDNSYEYRVKERLDMPMVFNGTAAKPTGSATDSYTVGGFNNLGSVPNAGAAYTTATNQIFAVAAKNDGTTTFNFANPQDLIRFQSGAIGIVVKELGPGVLNAAGSTTVYLIKQVGAKNITQSDIQNDQIGGIVGNAYGEYSKNAYETMNFESVERNWLTTSRHKISITGDAYTDVRWFGGTKNKADALWYFDKEEEETLKMRVMMERRLRFARRSMAAGASSYQEGDPAQSGLYPGAGGENTLTWDSSDAVNSKAPVIGDGLYAQIDDVNIESYNMDLGLTQDQLLYYLARLGQNAIGGNARGQVYVALAGRIGMLAMGRAAKDIAHIENGASLYSKDKGKNITISPEEAVTYTINNDKIVMIYDKMKDDPHLFGGNHRGLQGSGDIDFLDFSMVDGEPNIQLRSKNKRSLIQKYVPGMMNPFDANSMMASNSSDGFEVHWLAQINVQMANKYSCGILKGKQY